MFGTMVDPDSSCACTVWRDHYSVGGTGFKHFLGSQDLTRVLEKRRCELPTVVQQQDEWRAIGYDPICFECFCHTLCYDSLQLTVRTSINMQSNITRRYFLFHGVLRSFQETSITKTFKRVRAGKVFIGLVCREVDSVRGTGCADISRCITVDRHGRPIEGAAQKVVHSLTTGTSECSSIISLVLRPQF